MQNFVGYAGDIPDKSQGDLLLKMITQITNGESLPDSSCAYGDRMAIAGYGPGTIFGGECPTWSEDRSICLLLIGEVFNAGELIAEYDIEILAQAGTAEKLLALYQKLGNHIAVHLNGSFTIIIWDGSSDSLIIINDRLGLHPVYYATQERYLLIASKVHALLADPRLSREVNLVSIAEFLTFDHMLHDHTLLSNVNLMPQGSILLYQNSKISISSYWNIKYPEVYPLRKEEDYINEIQSYLRAAVRNVSNDDAPKGVLLSGGLDSRWLIAYLNEIKGDWPIHTFTFGIPGCDDARFAAEIAALTRSHHHFIELKSDFLVHTANEAIRLTDGMGNIVNLHALAPLEAEARYTSVMYKGFMGDAMFGFALRPQFWATYPDSLLTKVHFQVHQDQGVITFTEDEKSQLFSERFKSQIGDKVMENYRLGFLAAGNPSLAIQRLYFDLTQRVPRMTINGVEVVRSKATVRLPFCDNNLLDFAISIPPGWLYQRRLVQDAFVRAFPAMAKIPISWTGLPMLSNSREILMRSRRLLDWHMHKRGLKKTPVQLWKPYKDYNNWFRTDLRKWVEEILLSKQFMERGYYQPKFVENLWNQHLGGKNYATQLGALLSIELWHRQFLD